MTPEERQQEVYRKAAELMETAKSVLIDTASKGQGFFHVAFPLNTETKHYGLAPLSGDREIRKAELKVIHQFAKEKGYDALIIITDAWHTKVPDGVSKEEFFRRRDEGEKFEQGEGLAMLCCGKDIIPQTTTLYYERKGNEIVFGEQHTVYEFESWVVPKEWAPLPLSKGSA